MRLAFLIFLSVGSAYGQFTIPQRGSIASNSSAPSSFAYVASSVTGCYTNQTTNTCAYNLHTNPTAGHLGIVTLIWGSTTATPTFSCTNNTTWTAIGSAKAGTGFLAGDSGQMFYIKSLAAGANPELCTLTTSSSVGFMAWEYAEYSYTGTISALDGTPQYSITAASGGTATISGLTTSNSSDLVFVGCLGVTSTCSAGTGYTARNDTNACRSTGGTGNCNGGGTGDDFNGVTGGLIEEKVNVAAGAQSATFGAGTTDDVILGLVAF